MQAEQSEPEEISQKQDQAILALLEKPSMEEAAKAAGIGKTTLYRWLKNDEFKRRYHELRRELVRQSLHRIQQIMGDAVEALHQIVTDPAASPAARISAARELIKWSTQIAKEEEEELRREQEEKRNRIGRTFKVRKESLLYAGSDGRYYTEDDLKEVSKYEPVVVVIPNGGAAVPWPWEPEGSPLREVYECDLYTNADLAMEEYRALVEEEEAEEAAGSAEIDEEAGGKEEGVEEVGGVKEG